MKSDDFLQTDILAELQWEPRLNADHIDVSVNEGIVTLTGHVSSFVEKHGLRWRPERVYGVKAVADELDVELPDHCKRSDEEVAQSCVNALKSISTVPYEQIEVTVSNGWVRLEGVVEWQYQREAAMNAVGHLTGVVGVYGNITVLTHVSPSDVKGRSRRHSGVRPNRRPANHRRGVRRQGDPIRECPLVGRT